MLYKTRFLSRNAMSAHGRVAGAKLAWPSSPNCAGQRADRVRAATPSQVSSETLKKQHFGDTELYLALCWPALLVDEYKDELKVRVESDVEPRRCTAQCPHRHCAGAPSGFCYSPQCCRIIHITYWSLCDVRSMDAEDCLLARCRHADSTRFSLSRMRSAPTLIHI